MKHVVIDEGSSQIKVCWFDGGIKEMVIPSRIVDDGKLNNDGTFQDGAYDVDGSEYTVSSHFDGSVATNNRDYQTSEYNRVLVHEALRQAGFGGEDVTIYTTLPISDFFGVKPRNDALIAKKKENLTGGLINMAGHNLANIIDCKVWPEAIPAWLDLMINEQGGPALKVEDSYKIMIVDIGGTTTDLTIIDGKGGMQEFASERKGVFNISDNLSDYIRLDFSRKNVEAHQLDKALREKMFAGKDIKPLIEKACKPVIRDIYLRMTNFVDESDNLDAIVYVGGGAALIGKELSKQYGGNTIIGDQVSIARGILKKLINAGTVKAEQVA